MGIEHITSRSNQLMSHLRKVCNSKSHRRSCGQFLCDGPKLLQEALQWGGAIEVVISAQGVAVPRLPAQVRQVTVPMDLLQSIAPTENSQGVLFLCRQPQVTPPEGLTGRQYLVLDGVQDPGNVGTIWRTADAMDIDGVFLLPGCADPWSPKTVRSTMGAMFRLPLWEVTLEQLLSLTTTAQIPLYATALRADATDIRHSQLNRAAVVIGSEGRGIGGETLAQCEKSLIIPMSHRCESLNAAVAASIVLWEMAKP